jgi:hypothetical protein
MVGFMGIPVRHKRMTVGLPEVFPPALFLSRDTAGNKHGGAYPSKRACGRSPV